MTEQGKVIVSDHPIRTSECLDFNGNIIDPRTKRIIKLKEKEYVPDPADVARMFSAPAPETPPPTTTPPEAITAQPVSPVAKDDGLSVLEQIAQAEANLAKLKEAKQAKIEETEKLLKALKQ